VRLVHALSRVRRVLATLVRRPDAILLFTAPGLSFVEKTVCAFAARMVRARTVVAMRGGQFMDDCRRSAAHRRLARRMLRSADVVVCQTESWREFFRDELDVPSGRLAVVENWTATDDLLAIGASHRPATPDRMHVVFLGWVSPGKGVAELVDAFAALRAARAGAALTLTIAGDGGARVALAARVRELGLADVVRLPGWLDDDQRRRLLADADVFALPSHAEGLPNAMIEAMAAGLPVVVTPVGGIPDVIDHERNGLVVPVGDADSLAAALTRLLDDAALRTTLGHAAHVDS
jgi:glycosyltransferase involved in cell wall biosynthesis